VSGRVVQRHNSNMNILQAAYSSGRPDLQLVLSGRPSVCLSGNVRNEMRGRVLYWCWGSGTGHCGQPWLILIVVVVVVVVTSFSCPSVSSFQ